MVNYRLIIEYHQKGNNNTQVATLCSCSRMTVWKVVNRIRVGQVLFSSMVNFVSRVLMKMIQKIK